MNLGSRFPNDANCMNFFILFLLTTPLFHFVFITVNITAVCMADNQPISNIGYTFENDILIASVIV
jgi:hypothetical protein